MPRSIRSHRFAVATVAALLLVVALVAAPGARAESSEPAHQETRDLIALVGDAVALVEAEGPEPACEAFHVQGSKWLHDETYVFILDLAGNALCHPGRPSLEGRALIDLRDPYGKPIVQGFIRELEHGDDGWVHYLWPRPGAGTNFVWKTSYVRRARSGDGEYIVGSGAYQMPMERFFISEQVDDAVALIEAEDVAAFDTLRDKSSGYRFYDSYIFVMDADGVHLVNAAFPENEGKNLLDLRDESGKLIGREMLALLETQDAGWVDYMWPRPGNQPASRKSSYVRKTYLDDGRMVVVGAGIYLD